MWCSQFWPNRIRSRLFVCNAVHVYGDVCERTMARQAMRSPGGTKCSQAAAPSPAGPPRTASASLAAAPLEGNGRGPGYRLDPGEAPAERWPVGPQEAGAGACVPDHQPTLWTPAIRHRCPLPSGWCSANVFIRESPSRNTIHGWTYDAIPTPAKRAVSCSDPSAWEFQRDSRRVKNRAQGVA